MNNKTLCPLCESSSTLWVFKKEENNYYDCHACGFRFSITEKDFNMQDSITDFEDAYIQYFNENSTDQLNAAYLFRIHQHMNPSDNIRILDIGCGSGKWARYLKSKSKKVLGIEPSGPLFDRYLKGDGDFLFGTLNTSGILNKQNRFEVIYALDVLEHVSRPQEFVSDIASLQEKGDILFFEIPLFKSWPSLLLGKRWHFYNKYHVSYFSRNTLDFLMRKNGYEKVQGIYRGKYYNLGYLFSYLSNFVFGKKQNRKSPIAGFNLYLNTFDIYLACYKKSR